MPNYFFKPFKSGFACITISLILCGSANSVTCTTTATATAFGIYNPLSGGNNDVTGSVTVTCDPVLVSLFMPFTVKLATGGSGSFSPRKMSSGANQLNYQLYTNALRTQIWGDGTASTTFISSGILLAVILPASQVIPVYARLFSGQIGVPPGSYADTISVLVTY